MVNHNSPTRKPADWVPPVPAFSAHVDEPVTIAYYGIQCRGVDNQSDLSSFRQWCSAISEGPYAPQWRDCAEYVDADGYYTWLSIFYWRGSPRQFEGWASRPEHDAFWEDDLRVHGSSGFFREVLLVPNERLETLYSDADFDTGVGGGTGNHEGPIQSHNYWGSMRDRIPSSATERLEPEALLSRQGDRAPTLGRRVFTQPKAELCTIRSGEDFAHVTGREKSVFEEEIVPLVREGMLFLRDNPEATGCFSCHYMRETDPDGNPIARAFATAHFDSLTHLEDWAESHPTHLKIFGRFIELATELRGDVKLKLWHEVTVTPQSGQIFEYVNCAPNTGMLPYALEATPSAA